MTRAESGQGCLQGLFENTFSQTARVRERKAKGLHPVNEMQRFYILVCCFFCSTTVSITYAFDMFTTDLQSQFGLSSGDLATVSTVGLVVCYLKIQYSFIYEACGPFLLFIMCVVVGGLGSLLMALAFAGKVKGNVATFSVYYALLNMSSGLLDLAYITTLAELFPRNRGPVIALAKVMTSLGSSVLAVVCVNLFDGAIIGYIYFLMALVVCVGLWGAFTVTLPPYYMNWWRRRGKSAEEIAELEATKPYYEHKFVPMKRLVAGYVVVIAMIVFFAVQAPVLAYTKNVSRGSRVAVGVIAIVLLLSIFVVVLPLPCMGGMNEPAPAEAESEDAANERRKVSDSEPTAATQQAGYLAEDGLYLGELAEEAAAAPKSLTRQDPRYQGTLKDYLCGIDLWLIFFMTLTSGALGTIVTYNSSTISIALNGYGRSKELSALYTAFLGVGSAVGRLLIGLFEAYVQHQKPGQRRFIMTMVLPVAPVAATLAGILLLTVPGNAILLPFILVYFQTGWTAGVNVLVFVCLFENNHNSLYCLNFIFTMLMIVCFNRLMFGIYTDKKRASLGYAHSESCKEAVCVQMPIIVTTVLAFLSFFFALAIHLRYKRFLRRAHAAAVAAAEVEAEALTLADGDVGVPSKAVAVVDATPVALAEESSFSNSSEARAAE